MRLGVRTDPQRPVADEVAWAAGIGYEFIDLVMEAPGAALESTAWRDIGAQCAESALQVLVRAADYFVVNSPSPAIRQAALDEIRRTVDAAALLKAPLCTVPFLGWPAYLSEAAGYAFCTQVYTLLVRHGQERNVQIALENSVRNAHQLKYFREIFHRVPGLRLTYNVAHGNIQTAQILTRDYLFALADRLAHVAMSDNGGQFNDRLPFGAPSARALNLRRELQLLRSFSYDGTIALDIGGDRRWVEASGELLRQSWESAG